MTVGFNGLATLGGILTVDREDGTLLRAKATPNGMTGYLIGKVVTVSGTILIGVVITLIAGLFLFSGLARGQRGDLADAGPGAGARAAGDAADRRHPRLAVPQRPERRAC